MLECQRHEFGIEEGAHFLNCAYLGPVPLRAEEAALRGMALKRSPTDVPPARFYEESDRLRDRFARLIGAPADRIAIQPAVSYGIATAARALPVAAGQNLVLPGEQFPSNVYAWHRRAAEAGAEIRRVERPGRPPCGREWNERLLEAIDADTAVVALAPTHWTDGTRFDLEAIGARAREVGAALVLDASQSLGAMPFEVDRVRPDAVICCGYKWLLGPYGISLAYFGPRFDDGVPLEETWIAREGSEDFQGLVDYVEDYAPGAVRYDVGERSNFLLVPMMIEALELILAWEPARIARYAAGLLAPLAEALRARGWALEDDAWRGGHVLGVGLPPGTDVARLHADLERARVHVSLRGPSLRISPHVYNDPADVAALTAVLLETPAAVV